VAWECDETHLVCLGTAWNLCVCGGGAGGRWVDWVGQGRHFGAIQGAHWSTLGSTL
jgi:hypothetical protein